MLREHDSPGSIIFQRLQAEQALRATEREKVRLRIASNVRAVWSGRVFLIRLSALGLVLGLLVAFLIPARYTSTTRLMPPDNQVGSLASAAASAAVSHGGIFGEVATDMLGLKTSSEVFVGILTSRTVQNEIIEQFDLKRVYGARHMQDARRTLASRVDISVDRKNQIITISVTDRSPQRAEGMSKAYGDQLNRLVSELSTSSARRERIFLESRLAQVNQDLETAEKEFSQFSSKNSAIDIKEQEKAMVGAAATLQGQLMFARSELEAVRQIYTDSNPRVRAMKARIAELQSQLEKFGGKDQADNLGPDAEPATLYPSFRKLPLLGVTYADLYRRTKVQETLYEVLTQEYELAKAQEAREVPTVKVLDPADLPDQKSFPPRLLVATSTMLLACIGGIVFLVGSRSWNEKDPEDLSKAVATEIWIDLKEKRLMSSGNGGSHGPGAGSGNSLGRKQSIFSFLGLNKGARNGDRFYPSSGCVWEEERSEEDTRSPLAGSNSSGEEYSFRSTSSDQTAGLAEPRTD